MRRSHRPLVHLVVGLVLALLGGAALTGTAAAKSCDGARVSPAEQPRAAYRATLCLLNLERARRGLPRLRGHRRLDLAARRHSEDMVRRNYFAHVSPGGGTFVDRITRAKYPRRGGWTVAENIAWGGGELAQPARIVRSWMRSPGHRRNILDRRFRSIGIGIVRGVPVRATAAWARAGATYTTTFGSN